MSVKLVAYEGIVVSGEHGNQPAFTSDAGYPYDVGDAINWILAKHFGKRLRVTVEVIAEPQTTWKDV